MMTMNAQQFEEYKASDKPLLVEFWAPWCGYCRRIAPAMARIAGSREDIVVAQINIDEEPALSDAEQIEIIPTLVLYRGGKAIGSIVAPDSRGKIEEFIRYALER